MRLLVTRPQPAADATAARLVALGHAVVVAPLLETSAVAWTAPAVRPQALLLTSATAVRLAGPALARLTALPVLAVGPATATAARAAGFGDVRDAGGNVAAALGLAAAGGLRTLLHLAGADRTDVAVPAGLSVAVRTVYAAQLANDLGPARAALGAGKIDAVLLYSVRTARQFALLVDQAGIDRATVALAVLSAAVGTAAGAGWAATAVATAPREDAIFAAALGLCDKTRGQQG